MSAFSIVACALLTWSESLPTRQEKPSQSGANKSVLSSSGDGRADIVCFEKGGRITGWLNRASGMFNAGQIKLSEGW